VTALHRYHTLDALRFIAFLKVFLLHLPDNEQFPVYHFIKQGGGTGVALFFVLSGFLISDILLKEKEKQGVVNGFRFMIRRAFRIWPLYFLGVGMAFGGLLLAGYLGISSQTGYDPTPWTSLLFLENYRMILEGTHPNGVPLTVFWSLCVEEHFYVLWILIFVMVPLQQVKYFWLAGMVLGILTRWLSATHVIPYMLNGNEIVSALDYFAMGGIVALAKRHEGVRAWLSSRRLRWVTVLMAVLFLVFQHVFYAKLGILGVTVTAMAYAALIAVYVCASDGWLSVSNSSMWGRLGVISYGLYVFHTPCIMAFTKWVDAVGYGDTVWGLWWVGVGSLLMTVLMSFVVYRWVELRFLHLRARYFPV
jgi:peptidoglycan/LPS O-acetylase OafA/YrhL